MNKPYTCHHCATVFDALSDEDIDAVKLSGDLDIVARHLRIKVKCPGCYDAGYTAAQSIYMVDIDTMTVVT